MPKIEKALLSVSDKTGIVEFAKELSAYNIQFISTGGTAKILWRAGLDIMEVSDYTGYPEMMDGRVKTLHPRIHGGLLGVRSNPEHVREMDEFNIECIDMIVVNLNQPDINASDKDSQTRNLMENIDIGGLAMLRSAAKNFESVTVIVDPVDYSTVLADMRKNNGYVSVDTNLKLAIKVFKSTAEYDRKISELLKNYSLDYPLWACAGDSGPTSL